jgi:hypothetical protein
MMFAIILHPSIWWLKFKNIYKYDLNLSESESMYNILLTP